MRSAIGRYSPLPDTDTTLFDGPLMAEPGTSDIAAARAFGLATHGRVLASAAMLGSMVVLVKLAAFAKDWLVARRFGASDELDAFLVALVIPSYAVVVLAQSFGMAFMPTYIRVAHRDGAAAARRLATSALLTGAAALFAITLVLAVAARYLLPLIGTGFDESKLALAASLFYVLSGVLIASGISTILAAVLNAGERFAVASLAPLAVPLVTVLVFWFGQVRYGIYALAAGTLCGFVCETLILSVAAFCRGLLAWPHGSGFDASLRFIGRQYVPVAIGSLLMSSSLVVDQSMAASLGSGSVSVLNYGNKIVALVLGVIAVSLSTVLFPRFSRLIAEGRLAELTHTLRVFGALIVLVSIPLIIVLAILSEPIVRLVFERGAFTPETTAAVSEVQRWLLPQIPFYVLVMVGYRLLSALDGNALLLRIGALNLFMNVTGNLVFMHWFGVKGIAMSTSLVYVVATLATFTAIRIKLAEVRSPLIAQADQA
jgi:putative peptidoglycan lipid II flippase